MTGGGEREVLNEEERVASLQTRREVLEKKMKAMKVEINKNRRVLQKDSLALELARADYNYSLTLRDTVKRQYDGKLMDIENEGNKVYVTLAQPSNQPTTNSRTKLMAAAPVGTMAVVLSLFVLLEMGAGRVADPDDLRGRLNLGVIGVVPPLPAATPARGRCPGATGRSGRSAGSTSSCRASTTSGSPLCAGRTPGAAHRHCVLITSACGSEGKTTLAAQLAEPCVNAGLLTLLIDADLRQPDPEPAARRPRRPRA